MGLTHLDAGVLIGYLDSNDAHHQAARNALREALDRRDRLQLASSALAETLVGPARRGSGAITTVQEVIRRVPIEIVPLTAAIALEAAQVRVRHRALRLPDALVIATARIESADVLLTTDRGWPTAKQLGLPGSLETLPR